jgi:Rha family phage regulatory protein
MEELVYLSKKDEAVCSSLQVAEKFGKRHADVIRAINNLLENDSTQNCVRCFNKSSYTDAKGEKRPMYVMNRDGFTFLVMGFTGNKANEWKWQYIKAFNKMEEFIKEKKSQKWIDERKAGKLTRKSETDTIKRLVEYAKEQGSTHSEMLYTVYSKLANSMAGVKSRDEATRRELNNLSLMEHIILCEIDKGIVANKPYKEIYKDCKERLETVKELAYLEIA